MDSEDSKTTLNPLNRRVAPRLRSVFPVGMETRGGLFSQSRAINVSMSGLKVVVDQALGLGVSLDLTLCLDEDNLVELKATTVWQERLGTLGTHIVGLHFDEEQVRSRKDLQSWLRDREVAA